MERVVFAAWLVAAKSIASIICEDGTNNASEASRQAGSFFSHGTYHGISTYNFFNDLTASSSAPVRYFY
jgi:hypothetical protein